MMRPLATSLLLAVALFVTAGNLRADPADDFAVANASYEAGDYEAAYAAYRAIEKAGHLAPQLFYNLGNCAYRLDRPGEATLWYRRTLALAPGHPEARQNLRIIDDRTGRFAAETGGAANFAARLSPGFLIGLVAAGFWAMILGFLPPLLQQNGARPRCARILSGLRIAGSIIFIAGVTGYILRASLPPLDEQYVVTTAETAARTGAHADAREVIDLPEGSDVRRVANRQAWTYVEIEDGLRGWIRTDEITPVWPYDPALLE